MRSTRQTVQAIPYSGPAIPRRAHAPRHPIAPVLLTIGGTTSSAPGVRSPSRSSSMRCCGKRTATSIRGGGIATGSAAAEGPRLNGGANYARRPHPTLPLPVKGREIPSATPPLMAEVTHAGEDHSEAGVVGSSDHLVV